MSNMNKMKEETKVLYFLTSKSPKVSAEGEEQYYELWTKEFTITPWLKEEILVAMGHAMSENYYSPFIVLVPRSHISEMPDDFKASLDFLDSTLYIVPYLRKVLVYEEPREKDEDAG